MTKVSPYLDGTPAAEFVDLQLRSLLLSADIMSFEKGVWRRLSQDIPTVQYHCADE